MQIHELNTFAGTPGENNYLPIDNGSDTGKISGSSLLKPVNDRIDNLATNVTPDSAEVILDTPAGASPGPATLSKSVANFDYLEFYFAQIDGANINNAGYLRVPVSYNNVDVSIPVKDGSGLWVQELKLAWSGTTLTISNIKLWEWDGSANTAASSQSNVWVTDVIRVIGIKTSSNTSAELADIRLGANGVIYASAGDAVRAQVEDLNDKIDAFYTAADWEAVDLTLSANFYDIDGNYVTDTSRRHATITGVHVGDSFKLTTYLSSTLLPAVVFFYDSSFVSYLRPGTGSGEVLTDYEFIVPDGVNTVVVQSAKYNETIELYKKEQYVNVYTKQEVDDKLDLLQDEIDDVKDITTTTKVKWTDVSLTLQKGYYTYDTGVFTSDNSRRTAKIAVNEGEKYKLNTYIASALISGIVYFDSNDAVVSHLLDGTGTGQTISDYEFVVPAGVTSMAIQSASYTSPPVLAKYADVLEFVGYTKDEIAGHLRYGVRWSIADYDDLGERCFAAVGLEASIGIGPTDGASDFDNIYPWSMIKRCNIKYNAAGAPIVTFEGETGFSLDGSNGDVFVRIPKFYIEKYKENGYEYRTVSASGSTPHPAFVEDGVEIDEIFVGAFEGFIDSNNELRSIGGVIPTSTRTGATFLNAATANGENYSLYDMRCVDAIWTLMAVEFGCRNSNHFLGYGLSDFELPVSGDRRQVVTAASNTNTVRTTIWNATQKGLVPVGANITICDTDQTTVLTQAKVTACVDTPDGVYTDWTFDGDPIDVNTNCFIGSAAFSTNWCEDSPTGALAWHTGRNNWVSGSNTRNAVRYRWIENIFGNLWHNLPDITFVDRQMYVCKNMRSYEFLKSTGDYKPIGDTFPLNTDNGNKNDVVNVNYWITEITNDVFAKGVSFGMTYDKSLLSTKAFGAYYYLYNGTVFITNGGGFDHLYRCNMLTNRAWENATSAWYLYGARMMFKYIS